MQGNKTEHCNHRCSHLLALQDGRSHPGFEDSPTVVIEDMKSRVGKGLALGFLLLLLSVSLSAQNREAQLAEARRLNQETVKLYEAGRYDEAIVLEERMLAIFQNVRGAEHPDVAATLNNLAESYAANGDYHHAERLFKEAMAIWEKVLRPDHPDLSPTLNNFASLYFDMGDYARAEPLYQRAMAIDEKANGKVHPQVAIDANNLSALYAEKGDYAHARPLLLRALAIRERLLPADDPLIAATLHNLAQLSRQEGDFAQAESLFKRALALREKVLGAEHPLVANTLDGLAALYDAKGDHLQAEPLFLRALAILEKTLGAEHPSVGMSLNNLAHLYQAKGDYSVAASFYQRSLVILEKALGPNHLLVAGGFANSASLSEASGNYELAVKFLAKALEIRERNLALVLDTGSEDQKQLFLNKFAGETDSCISLHLNSAPSSPEAAQLAVTAILQRKGRALDAMTDQISSLRQRAVAQDQILLDRLAALRSDLATLQISGGGQMSLVARRNKIAEREAEVERFEAEIGKRSAEFRAKTQAVTLTALREALPPDEALVEIYAYHPINPKARLLSEKYGAEQYVAYVIQRDQAVPQWAVLGDASKIDGEVKRLRSALADPNRSDVQDLSRALDELVMRPIRGLLGQNRRLFLSPDGALNLIPFGALIDEHSRYLAENYSLTYLTSGRDLLRLQVDSESSAVAVAVANPLYNLVPSKGAKSLTNPSVAGNRRSVDFTIQDYKTLADTSEEAWIIGRLWPGSQLLLQEKATESALKQIHRPRLLHIATHGFFLSDQLPPSPAPTSDTQSESPMLRSGLVLAGVKQGESGPGQDGVLTALELAGLDLWGTKLVVLSACDTGLGEVRNGAGVYGLRRALVLAGSEAQVISLWKVSDSGTRDLMTAFYGRLKRGEGRTEALRQVQLAMLRGELTPATSAPSGQRETRDTSRDVPKDYRHPYYWAAFIQSGDWRSIDGK